MRTGRSDRIRRGGRPWWGMVPLTEPYWYVPVKGIDQSTHHPGNRVTTGPRRVDPSHLRRVVTSSAGSPAICAGVNRSVTHCLRENSRVWSEKWGDAGFADSP